MRRMQLAASGALVAALALSAATAWAHHSMIAEFDLQSTITLKGTITKMEWVNPHGWIHVDVTDAEGMVTSWAVETGSPFQLKKRGLSIADFAPGTRVLIAAFKAKNGTNTAAGWVVTFVDRKAALDDEGFEAGETSFALGR